MQTKRLAKTKKKSATNQQSIVELEDDCDIIVKSKIPNKSSELTSEQLGVPNYFTEKDLTRILSNLDALRYDVYPQENNELDDTKITPNFPSVCLIGLGRCGSNIALDVASLVHNARNYYLNEFHDEENKLKEKESRAVKWIQRSLKLTDAQVIKPIFLMEPLVMLGDLDKISKVEFAFHPKVRQIISLLNTAN